MKWQYGRRWGFVRQWRVGGGLWPLLKGWEGGLEMSSTLRKQNGFKTANNKPVKHQELFQAGDAIVTEHDIIVYWVMHLLWRGHRFGH